MGRTAEKVGSLLLAVGVISFMVGTFVGFIFLGGDPADYPYRHSMRLDWTLLGMILGGLLLMTAGIYILDAS